MKSQACFSGALITVTVFVTLFYFIHDTAQPFENFCDRERTFVSYNFLDDCFHIYLDMGSNAGVQVMKLFQPEWFPNADVIPVYNTFFGTIEERRRPNHVCVVGFEPNPVFKNQLWGKH